MLCMKGGGKMLVIFDGGKLLAARKAKKLSQATIAATADTTVRYVRDMEKGIKPNPSAAMVYTLCKFRWKP